MELKKTKDYMKKRTIQVLLPITLLSFLLSYYYFSCISCFIHSQNLAIKCFIHNNKCLFLLSNIIIIFFAAADAGLLISSSSISGNGLYDEYVTHVASQYQQNSQIMVSGHDHEQSTNEVLKVELFEEEIVIEECVHQSMNLIMVEEGGEGEKVVEFVTQVSGHDHEQSTNEVLKVELFEEEIVIEECVHQSMNLIMVEEGGKGEKEEEEEEEVLDLLDIDDLNRRFEEFIATEKKKWKLEALKLVML
ncbi:Apc36109-like domain-containing protein [Dioscorea alata]|uniref:Apc36109-like domain-containing protein n=1 Tax=Dioscorea alata TaxID=55571 RepID=A0ACB7VH13_DIOAL|nr:Apc36109-like domain-containing protein [Dioscorea alata]